MHNFDWKNVFTFLGICSGLFSAFIVLGISSDEYDKFPKERKAKVMSSLKKSLVLMIIFMALAIGLK